MIAYEIGTITRPAAGQRPFVLVRINTGKRVGNGCEAIVASLHWTRDEAQQAKALAEAKAGGAG